MLGRLGGLKGGKARAEALTPERRKEIARKAIAARWAKPKTSTGGGSAEPWSGADFFKAKSVEQLIAEQHTHPVTDISILAGAIPDEDVDEFVADIYRSRLP